MSCDPVSDQSAITVTGVRPTKLSAQDTTLGSRDLTSGNSGASDTLRVSGSLESRVSRYLIGSRGVTR